MRNFNYTISSVFWDILTIQLVHSYLILFLQATRMVITAEINMESLIHSYKTSYIIAASEINLWSDKIVILIQWLFSYIFSVGFDIFVFSLWLDTLKCSILSKIFLLQTFKVFPLYLNTLLYPFYQAWNAVICLVFFGDTVIIGNFWGQISSQKSDSFSSTLEIKKSHELGSGV